MCPSALVDVLQAKPLSRQLEKLAEHTHTEGLIEEAPHIGLVAGRGVERRGRSPWVGTSISG